MRAIVSSVESISEGEPRSITLSATKYDCDTITFFYGERSMNHGTLRFIDYID